MAIMVRAYSELSTTRAFGMSLGPIPWTAMVQWCEYHDLERPVATHLIEVLRYIDADTLRRDAERQKNGGKSEKPRERKSAVLGGGPS
jgi:hypothetical protein